jgi:hypothetical protein
METTSSIEEDMICAIGWRMVVRSMFSQPRHFHVVEADQTDICRHLQPACPASAESAPIVSTSSPQK